MKPRSIILFFGLLFSITSILSQTDGLEVPNFSIHSPDVTSLGQYVEYPVDVSTGVPKIEIPLYTIKSGGLELPMSLSYHASGIKVDQEASLVGLGWSLNAAGVVTRVIRDDPDEENNTGFLVRGNILPDYNPIDDDFPYGTVGNDPGINGPLQTNYRRDKEPDVFNIHGVNLNGEFCLDNTLEFVSTDYSPREYDVDIFDERIVVTDEKGITYRFGRSLENEEAFETTLIETSTIDIRNQVNPTISSQPVHNSSWHLTEMISSNRRDTIKFKYTSHHYRGRFFSMSRYVLTNHLLFKEDARGTFFDSTILSTASTTIPNTRVLDSILFKNGSIKFSKATDRLDAMLPRITGFTVFDRNGHRIKRIQFENNDFFNRTASGVGINNMPIQDDDIRRKSLKLDGVTFYDGNDAFMKDYTFEYDMTPMPPRETTPQDFWGYYNGASSGPSATLIPTSFHTYSAGGRPIYLGQNRNANYDFMKAGVLTKIGYPTGGHTVYDYEPHYYLKEEHAQGLTQKKRKISLFAINRQPSCHPDFLFGVPTNNILEFEVTEDLGAPFIFGELTIMFSDYVLLNGAHNMTYRLTDLNGGDTYTFEHSPSDKANIKVIDREQIRIRAGHRYRLEAMTNGVTGSNTSMCNSPWIESTLTYDYWEPTDNTQEITPTQAGGLRVKTILSYSSDNTLLTRKRYTYGDVLYGPDNVGVGTLITDPSKNFYYYPLLYYSSPHIADLRDVLWFTSDSQVGLGLNNGSPVDYGKVTEYTMSLEDSKVTNGKTEYYYSHIGRNLDLSWANSNRPYNRFIYPSWKKSNLDSVVHYKQMDNLGYLPVKSEEYRYRDLPEKRIKILKMIEEEPDVFSVSGGIQQFLNPNRFYYYNFYVSVGRKMNSRKIVKEYENGLNTMTSTTNYFYENPDHLQLTGTNSITSTGKMTRTRIFYPDDITTTVDLGYGALSLSEFNAIRKLQKPSLDNPSGQHRISEPIQMETMVSNSSGVVVSRTVQRTNYGEWPTGLVSPDSIVAFKGTYDSLTNPMEERMVYHNYDDNNNPIEVSQANGPHIYYVWGYRQEYPIAKLENFTSADATSIQTIIDAAVQASDVDTDDISENLLRNALEQLRNSAGTAQVTTYTYDPLIGVTSITDSRGYTTYYEYDAYNRLKEVRDADGNLVTDYEYHYQSQNKQ